MPSRRPAKLVNAAAIAVFERPDLQVELLPFDTRGTPEGAASAASEGWYSNVTLVPTGVTSHDSGGTPYQ